MEDLRECNDSALIDMVMNVEPLYNDRFTVDRCTLELFYQFNETQYQTFADAIEEENCIFEGE